jgi:hypothetical protein
MKLTKLINSNNKKTFSIVLGLGLVVLVVILIQYNNDKSRVYDGMTTPQTTPQITTVSQPPVLGTANTLTQDSNLPVMPQQQNQVQQNQPSDLLPPTEGMENMNWLIPPENIIGINTISNSLHYPSYDIRGDPPIPLIEIGPWNQTTATGPDVYAKGLGADHAN